MENISNIVLYNDGELELKVSFNEETIWLRQDEISLLFGVDRTSVTKHINKILKDNEVEENSNVQKMHFANSDKPVKIYSLDIILAVGYRTNSSKAMKFRQWASSVLKNYIQNGYAINTHKITEQRLTVLENDIQIIKSHIKNNTLEIKHGIFFNGQIFDAYVLLSDLIKSAKVSITLIDNYVDESILNLFSKNKNVRFTIFTQNISKELQLDIQKYNKQYYNLEVKITKNFHDRFLICDETVYHFGASFKDLGNKIFAVNRMNISVNDLLKGI